MVLNRQPVLYGGRLTGRQPDRLSLRGIDLDQKVREDKAQAQCTCSVFTRATTSSEPPIGPGHLLQPPARQTPE